MKPRILSLSLLLLACLPAAAQPSRSPQAKVAGAAFYTQTFPSIPSGWTISADPGSVAGWRWANAAPSGTGNTYPINGTIGSTTRNNGWLLYNADSVLSRIGTIRPFGGSITSAAIPVGAAHTNVMLSFQQYYRYSTGDSCYVDVSANGTTWTAFPLTTNTALTQFGFLYSNPAITTINISSVVGGQASAYIRFRFISSAATYSFNWLIDDLVLYDADPTDLGITWSGIVAPSETAAGFSTNYGFSSIPLRFADTVYPITYLSNYGLSAASNTVVTARYYLGNTLLSTETATAAATPREARDSIVIFPSGYKPTAAGDYVVALSISDGVSANNADTIRFSVTDTVYAPYGTRFTERNCFLNRPSAASLYYWGSRFTVSNGQRDTLTSVSAAFRPETVPGERVQAQLYQATGTAGSFSWTPLAVSVVRTLSAADISGPGNVVMVPFAMRVPGGNYTPLIVADGDYAVVLTTVNSTRDVAVYSMVPPFPAAPAFIGYQGQSDISPNDVDYGFASGGGIATGLTEVPLVRPNFGNSRALLSVQRTAGVELGAAFPNPANTELHIPVVLQQSAKAELTLSNSLGQTVARADLGYMGAGLMKLASVPTAHLPEGVYFYTVRTEGGRAAGRVMIRH